MNELLINVKLLKNDIYKKIMLRLIEIYQEECSCNEGSLTFADLMLIFSQFYFLEKGESLC